MSKPTGKRPNILWISFEDTNPFYGCYGDPVAKTPNLDKLAAEGGIWPNAFATAGVCAPARSAVITGLYPISAGSLHMRTTHTNDATPELPTPYDTVIPHYAKCFSEYLRAAGYYCTNNEKTDYQFAPPITAWDDCSSNGHWRNRPNPDQPFFAVFNLGQTHESFMWEEKTPEYDVDPDAVVLPPTFPDTPKVREAMARMYTRIQNNDKILGEMLQQLQDDGLADNTIVMHWSDHGPLPRGKRWPYDSGIHVPMIIRWPGHIEPGTICEDLVSTVDLAPTVMSMIGMDIPQHFQGQAFLGAKAEAPRDYIFASRDRYDESYDMVRAVRDQRFKYIRNFRPELPYLLWIPYRNQHPIIQEMYRLQQEDKLEGAQKVMFQYPRPVEELYDIEVDPHETNNLAGDPDYAEDLERLRYAVDDWRAAVGDLGEVDEAEMVRGWYPDGVQPTTVVPIFVPICNESPGRLSAGEGGTYQGPLMVQLHSATQGASIAYTFEEGDSPKWQLYTQPITMPKGTTTVRAVSIRIGYKQSEERSATFTVA